MNTPLRTWLSDRIGTGSVIERLRVQSVKDRSLSLYLAGVLLMLFVLQIASGVLLMLPYRADPQHAHASVVAIAGRMPYGSLIRGVHAWCSQLFVALLLLQLGVMLVYRGYREPREVAWWAVLFLLVVGVGMAFTGAMLPWNENAYLEARVSSEMIGQGPLFGPWLKRMLRGGDELTPWSLNHAFGFHTGVLPLMATGLLFGHVALLRRRQDLSGPTIPFYPDFLVRLAAACTAVLVVIITLATFAPIAVGEPVDLTRATPRDATPPWYLLFVHELLRVAPPRLLGLPSAQFILFGLSLLALFAVALPFIDRRGSRITAYVAGVLIVLFLALTGHALL